MSEPTTEAGRNLAVRINGSSSLSYLFMAEATTAIVAIEAEARAAERERMLDVAEEALASVPVFEIAGQPAETPRWYAEGYDRARRDVIAALERPVQ